MRVAGAGTPDMNGGVRDPARRRDRCRRSPEAEQREWAEALRELVAQFERLGVAVRQLAAVRPVDRPRGDADVMRRRHVVPPEQVGGRECRIAPLARLPDLLAVHQPAGLAPQEHFHQVAEQPAVGDDAVIARQRAGHERRLHRAGDGGRHRRQRANGSATGKARELRRIRAEMAWGEPHHQDGDRRMHAMRSSRTLIRSRRRIRTSGRPVRRCRAGSRSGGPPSASIRTSRRWPDRGAPVDR